MKLKEALSVAYNKKVHEVELTDPFLLYSILSDYCTRTFEGRREVKIYWSVIKRVNIFSTLLEYNYERAIEILGRDYYLVCENTSLNAYKTCVFLTCVAMYPSVFDKEGGKEKFESLFEYKSKNKKMTQLDKLLKEKYKAQSPYDIVDGVLIKYTGKEKDLVIPPEVKIIKMYAFNNLSGLNSVVIPETVEVVEPYAFNDNRNLTSITIAPYVRNVGDFAFWGSPNVRIICKTYDRSNWGRYWNAYARKDNLYKLSYAKYVEGSL